MSDFPWLVTGKVKNFTVSDDQTLIRFEDESGLIFNGEIVLEKYDDLAIPKNRNTIFYTLFDDNYDLEKYLIIRNAKIKNRSNSQNKII